MLLEKNEKLGKKLYITGKGRCNLTNACDTEELFQNVLRNRKFLYSAIYSFSNWQAMDFFEEQGLTLKTERGQRVFPNALLPKLLPSSLLHRRRLQLFFPYIFHTCLFVLLFTPSQNNASVQNRQYNQFHHCHKIDILPKLALIIPNFEKQFSVFSYRQPSAAH